MTDTLECFHCRAAFDLTVAGPMRPWGAFRVPSRGLVIEPKGAMPWRCPRCHWITIFEPVAPEQQVA